MDYPLTKVNTRRCMHCGEPVARQGAFDERGPDKGPLVTITNPYDLAARDCRTRFPGLKPHEVAS